MLRNKHDNFVTEQKGTRSKWNHTWSGSCPPNTDVDLPHDFSATIQRLIGQTLERTTRARKKHRNIRHGPDFAPTGMKGDNPLGIWSWERQQC